MTDVAAVAAVNIGEAAARSGVSAKMVRHYEALGLIAGVARRNNGYRQYSERDIPHCNSSSARGISASMAEIAELVSLWQNRRHERQRQSALRRRMPRFASTH